MDFKLRMSAIIELKWTTVIYLTMTLGFIFVQFSPFTFPLHYSPLPTISTFCMYDYMTIIIPSSIMVFGICEFFNFYNFLVFCSLFIFLKTCISFGFKKFHYVYGWGRCFLCSPTTHSIFYFRDAEKKKQLLFLFPRKSSSVI